jgi:hypothetical protein
MLIIIISYISGNSKERGEKVPLQAAMPQKSLLRNRHKKRALPSERSVFIMQR